MRTNDYPKIPRVRRSLFYRYGPVVFESQFDSALEIFRENQSPHETPIFEAGAWAAEVAVIAKILAAIRKGEESPYDADRLQFQEAYEELVLKKNRLPTQQELFRKKWKLSAMPSVREHRREWTGDLLREKLDAIYDGQLVDEKIRQPPNDLKSYRDKIAVMGLVFLDGHKLNRYERLYLEMKVAREDGNPPTLPEFVQKALEIFCPTAVSARELTFPDFLEVLATPFSWIPENRWSQGIQLFQEVIDDAMTNRSLDEDQHKRLSALYGLIIECGNDLEVFVEGSSLPFETDAEERWILERRRIFSRTVARLGRIPDFCEMWLKNSEWVDFIEKAGGAINMQMDLFKRLAISYQSHSDASGTPTVDQLSADIPEIGTLADLVEPEVIFRELMTYFCSVDMEKSCDLSRG